MPVGAQVKPEPLALTFQRGFTPLRHKFFDRSNLRQPVPRLVNLAGKRQEARKERDAHHQGGDKGV